MIDSEQNCILSFLSIRYLLISYILIYIIYGWYYTFIIIVSVLMLRSHCKQNIGYYVQCTLERVWTWPTICLLLTMADHLAIIVEFEWLANERWRFSRHSFTYILVHEHLETDYIMHFYQKIFKSESNANVWKKKLYSSRIWHELK